MRKKHIWLKTIVILIPFILGTIGLYLAGERLGEAMYYSLGMYFMAYMDIAPNLLVEIARWSAPLMTAGSIIMVVKSMYGDVQNKIKAMFCQGIAVYCQEEKREILAEVIPNAIFVKEGIRKDVKEHIICTGDDRLNLVLAKKIEKGNIYIELEEIDSFLMRPGTYHFFNKNEMLARKFWKEHSLVMENVSSYKIGIVGDNALADMMLKYGLMNNIYDLEQRIEYHVYKQKNQKYAGMEMANADRIFYHGQIEDSLNQMDRVIICEEYAIPLIEQILYHTAETLIFYYSRSGAELEKIYATNRVNAFGYDFYSKENIMTNDMYRNAQALNYHYECMYNGRDPKDPNREMIMEELYNELSGFLKGSNLASCDYHDIRRQILEKEGNPEVVQDDKYVQLEHIRWCRFYYVNHWKHGNPKDKAERDKYRIHKCLVPYDMLSREDKDKDLEMIRILLEVCKASV